VENNDEVRLVRFGGVIKGSIGGTVTSGVGSHHGNASSSV
jgi:hypothetical protein